MGRPKRPSRGSNVGNKRHISWHRLPADVVARTSSPCPRAFSPCLGWKPRPLHGLAGHATSWAVRLTMAVPPRIAWHSPERSEGGGIKGPLNLRRGAPTQSAVVPALRASWTLGHAIPPPSALSFPQLWERLSAWFSCPRASSEQPRPARRAGSISPRQRLGIRRPARCPA